VEILRWEANSVYNAIPRAHSDRNYRGESVVQILARKRMLILRVFAVSCGVSCQLRCEWRERRNDGTPTRGFLRDRHAF
jgi:hypothetical protein